jgi:phosphate acyltransferase
VLFRSDLTREAHRLLKAGPLNFIGNIEARDVYTGHADVIVCDGFTGNIALKISEGLVDMLEGLLRADLAKQTGGHGHSLAVGRAFSRLRRRMDYSEYGGAPLLGVAGLCIVGHGRSTIKAVTSAVRVAAQLSADGFVDRIEREIAATGEPQP